jgi:quinol-cytochrome oxidoreductase complex cytochrome b subunit
MRPPPTRASRPHGETLEGARVLLLTVLSLEVAVLVVTGIALFFLYRPSTSQAWSFVDVTDTGLRVAHGLRLVHLLASVLAVFTAIATGIVVVITSRVAVRRWAGSATGVGIAVTALVASYTGFLLPWDQLALWAVTVDSNMRGYRPLFGPTVRFVLLGGVEVGPGTVIRWLLIHMLVLGPGMALLVALGWRRRAQ